MKPLKRLFLVMPLMILFICLSITVVIPILYWVFTGEDWIELKDEIIWLGESQWAKDDWYLIPTFNLHVEYKCFSFHFLKFTLELAY